MEGHPTAFQEPQARSPVKHRPASRREGNLGSCGGLPQRGRQPELRG